MRAPARVHTPIAWSPYNPDAGHTLEAASFPGDLSRTLLELNLGVVSARTVKLTAAAALLFLIACRTGPERAPAIGQAYVAPAVLKIRSDFPLDSAVVATVKHGDRLEILQRRRVFYRVRTALGAEGWTEAHQLLSSAEMAALQDLADRAAKMPPQGEGFAYEKLNVHTEPFRQAPAFLQIKAQERFLVLGSADVPRTRVPRPPLITPPPKKAPPEKKESRRESGSRFHVPPPPLPIPPGPPPDWVELSKPAADIDDSEAGATDEPAPEAKAQPKPVPTDDWSLVRTKDGETGWVLRRLIAMAIPDEVAQYAEGHRIVSYFSLAGSEDPGKHTWLWTTASEGDHTYDFDSFRVFIWSMGHHRYETAYIQRNVRGYAPVLLTNVDFALNSRSEAEKYPGFSVCIENSQGQRVRRSFALLGNIVRFAGEEPCQPTPPVYSPPSDSATASNPAPTPPAPPESLFQRWKKRLKAVLHR
jgi:SH3-like domain-containing protein